jgi:hypothetical protein
VRNSPLKAEFISTELKASSHPSAHFLQVCAQIAPNGNVSSFAMAATFNTAWIKTQQTHFPAISTARQK